jgi:hypothetical protein
VATLGEEYLIQQIGGEVILFHRHTEEEIVRYNVRDTKAMLVAQQVIDSHDRLNMQEKGQAHFWSGYFYAHATK